MLCLPERRSRPACVTVEAGLRTDKITTHNYEFTGGLKGNLAEFGDYFKTWNWESGFRYNQDQRIELFGGIVDNNALRAALLDTNPATAFNPFSINQNSPAVINKIFVTTHRFGTASLMLEDLKLHGNLWNLPAGPIAFAIGGEHRTEHETDQPDALTASGQTTGNPRLTYSQPRGAVTSGPSTGRFAFLLLALPGTALVSTAWN